MTKPRFSDSDMKMLQSAADLIYQRKKEADALTLGAAVTLEIPALYVQPLAKLTAELRDNPSVLEAAKMDYATEVWTWLCDRLVELAKEQDAE